MSNAISQQDTSLSPAVSVYPNPAGDAALLAVSSPREGILTIQLVDASGRIILVQNETINSGNSSVTINTAHVPAGMYTVQISGPVIASRKLIVQ